MNNLTQTIQNMEAAFYLTAGIIGFWGFIILVLGFAILSTLSNIDKNINKLVDKDSQIK
jgi:hypothetical protein